MPGLQNVLKENDLETKNSLGTLVTCISEF